MPVSLAVADKIWTIAGPIIGALLGARWAIGSHRQKEWWNRRADAYSAVLAAMEKLERAAGYMERHYEPGTQEVFADPDFIEEFTVARRPSSRDFTGHVLLFCPRSARS